MADLQKAMQRYIERIARLETLSAEAIENADEERLFSETCALQELIREARVIMARAQA